MRVVVIGGVAAGLKAASKAGRCDQHAEITVVEKGDLIFYGAWGMPYCVAGDVAEVEDLLKTPVGVVRNPGYFKNVKNITALTRTLAKKSLRELNKDDEIIAFCKISLRGYEAEGILEGEDFKNVKVLEGGVFSWPFECEK